MTSGEPTRMDYQQLRQVVLDLGFWVDERSSGPRPTIRRGPHRDSPPFRGLYLNEWNCRAYFTQRRIGGQLKWPQDRQPDQALWVFPTAINLWHQRDGRYNCTPKDGLEREAIGQFLRP